MAKRSHDRKPQGHSNRDEEMSKGESLPESTASPMNQGDESSNSSKCPPDQEQASSESTPSAEPASQGSGADQTEIAPLQAEIESLRREAEEQRGRAMRWQAEFENYQKRIQRQMVDDHRYALADLIRDLLPVLDNLQRAIEAAERSHDLPALLAGLNLIAKHWQDVLAKHDCRRIDALKQPFDPNLHHAISRQPTGDFPPNTVIYVTQEGYTLHDRVVRPSQVVVSMPVEEQSEAAEPG